MKGKKFIESEINMLERVNAIKTFFALLEIQKLPLDEVESSVVYT